MHIDSLDNSEIFCDDSLYQPVGITYNPNKKIFAICNNGSNTITFVQVNDTITNIEHLIKESSNDIEVICNSSLNEIEVIFYAYSRKRYQLNLVDMTGRILINKSFQISFAGKNSIHLNTTGIPEGTYLVRLSNGGTVSGVKKIILN